MAGVVQQLQDHTHEEVVLWWDEAVELEGHHRRPRHHPGAALGGVRMIAYQSEAAAVADALRLSEAMTYKAALAGLDLGGGKAVIVEGREQEPGVVRSFGRFVDSLNGRYITAADVGTDETDMAQIHEATRFVRGYPSSLGGHGDPSLLTAVIAGTKACVKAVFGVDVFASRPIAIQGLGKVGYQLARYMLAAGARVVGADMSRAAAERARASLGIPVVAPGGDDRVPADVFAPCGLGGILDRETVSVLQAPIVAGAANNQLAEVSGELALRERGVLYAPDFAINAGGLISVTAGLGAYDQTEAWQRTAQIRDTIARVIARARGQNISTRQAAQDLALSRITRRRAATAS